MSFGRGGMAWLNVVWFVLAMLLVDRACSLHSVMQPTRLLIGKNVTLRESDHAFMHSSTDIVHFEITSKSCGLSKNLTVNLLSHVGVDGYAMDVLGFQWYLFYYSIHGDDDLHLVIEGDLSYSLVLKWPSLSTCVSNRGLTFVFGLNSEVAISFNSDAMHSSPYPTLSSKTYPGGENRYFRTTAHNHAQGSFHAFVPIGMMILFVGVCVRCCHYCRYKAQLRKRTRGVMDNEAVEEGEATSTTPPTRAPLPSQDAPPQYDEICASEPPPPSYAELFQIVVAASAESKAKDAASSENQSLLSQAGEMEEGLARSSTMPQSSGSSDSDCPPYQERVALISSTQEPFDDSENDSPDSLSSGDLGTPSNTLTCDAVSRPSTALRAWASLNQARLKTHFAFRRLVEERDDKQSPSSDLK